MVKSPKIKILNIISGSKYGGAELFFERLALSFERCDKIEQKIIIRNNRNTSKKFIDVDKNEPNKKKHAKSHAHSSSHSASKAASRGT